MFHKFNLFLWIKRLLLFLILGGGYLLFYRTGLWHFFADKEQMLLFIASLGAWDEIGFVLLQAVQVVIPLIPGLVLNVLGGYLYGTVSGVIYSSIGTSIVW